MLVLKTYHKGENRKMVVSIHDRRNNLAEKLRKKLTYSDLAYLHMQLSGMASADPRHEAILDKLKEVVCTVITQIGA